MPKAHHAPATIPGLCFEALRRHNKRDAVNHKQAGGQWVHTSALEFAQRVRTIALGLANLLGISKGDRRRFAF
ncbi:MAG: hypothetical protein WKF84_04855 [Pyrinomonadaceae bacterium]